MRVRPNHVRMDERGSLPLARVLDGALERLVARDQIAAVDLFDVQVGEGSNELRDAAARRVHLDRNGDRVAVVFDQIDDRQLEIRRVVERLPELAFARRAVAGRAEDDLVLLEPFGDPELLGAENRFGAADGLQELRAGRRRARDDVELLVPPVARHLAAAGVGVLRGADSGEEHLFAGHAEHEAKRAVAVVRVEPVVRRAEDEPGRRQHGFVPGARDLKEDLVLTLELDLLVVQPTGQEHRAIRAHELVAGEAGGVLPLGTRRCRHGSPGCQTNAGKLTSDRSGGDWSSGVETR